MATNHESMLFFGSGPVAAKSLQQLSHICMIEAIITKPATVREMQRILPDVPVHAVQHKKELDQLFSGHPFKSRLALLIDFGIIVSKTVIDYFDLGIINSHFSLLPQWRGADPITFAILSGQQQTGISLMLVSEGMDEGPLLAQSPYSIPNGTTTPELTDALIELSNATLELTLPLYLEGKVLPMPQEQESMADNMAATYSRKLTKEDGVIDWTKPAVQLEREIRAFLEWPKSHTELAGKEVIILAAIVADKQGTPGGVLVENKQLFVYTGKDSLEILRLKPAGKAAMDASAFLAGYQQYL